MVHMRIDATGMSEKDGDRLRGLLQLFAERADEAREDYERARDEYEGSATLAMRRTRWKAWHAAWHELVEGFNWSSVPSVIPAEARELLAAERRRKAVELAELTARVRDSTRGTPEGSVDEELRRLRGGDES